MNAQPGITSPDNWPIRDPKDPKQKNGRVVNPVRFPEMGGATGPKAWPTGSDYPVTDRGNGVSVAKPAGEGKIGKGRR